MSQKTPGLFAGHNPNRGSDQEVFKSRGSGQVGSILFQISRVESGRVKR